MTSGLDDQGHHPPGALRKRSLPKNRCGRPRKALVCKGDHYGFVAKGYDISRILRVCELEVMVKNEFDDLALKHGDLSYSYVGLSVDHVWICG